MAPQRAQKQAPSSLILDSGAVFALAQHDALARAELTAAWEAGAEVVVPSVVVAETVRGSGPRDAPVNRVIGAVGSVTAVTEDRARTAGALLAAARSSSTIDALVVAEAAARSEVVILTGDADDLRRLASSHRGIVIRSLDSRRR